jgi:hypothetical protein
MTEHSQSVHTGDIRLANRDVRRLGSACRSYGAVYAIVQDRQMHSPGKSFPVHESTSRLRGHVSLVLASGAGKCLLSFSGSKFQEVNDAGNGNEA